MRRRIYLHGPLKQATAAKFIEIEGDTVADCVEGISRQLPYFRPDAVTGMKRIQVVDHDTEQSLHVPLGEKRDIHIVPAVSFGKDGGLVQTIVGVVLIVVGAVTGQAWLVSVGVSLTLGGIMQMLAPQPPSLAPGSEDERSKYLGAPGNTAGIGTRIPVLLGRFLVQGHILAFDIDAADAGT